MNSPAPTTRRKSCPIMLRVRGIVFMPVNLAMDLGIGDGIPTFVKDYSLER